MPPPTPSTALPARVELDRADRHVELTCPPRVTPNRLCRNRLRDGAAPSRDSSSRARIFGVPVTDAGGNVASSTAAIGTSASTRAETVDTRCHTPGAGRTTSSSGTVTDPGDRDPAQIVAYQVDDHDVLGDVLDRRAQRRRVRMPRQRALDRARRRPPRRGAAGTAPATATPPRPSRRRGRPPARGRCAATASAKKSTGAPSTRPVNCVHTHAW